MSKETPEIMVTGNVVPQRLWESASNAVCLLKPGSSATEIKPGSSVTVGDNWRATGFYCKIEISYEKRTALHCIMTNHHVYRMAEKADEMVAVFNFLGDNENPIEVTVRPKEIRAHSEELDYAFVLVDKDKMNSLKIEPIIAGIQYDPISDDIVHIIQHPGGREKHFSADKIKIIDPPFMQYNADTSLGSSGSPVLVVHGNKLVLVAIHSTGVETSTYNYNKGVLIREIVNHLKTGKYTKPRPNVVPAVPAKLKISSLVPKGTKDPNLCVTEDDINNIASDICDEWKPLALALGVPRNTIVQIGIDHRHDSVFWQSYQMLLKWKQTKVSEANYGALVAGFRRVSRNDLIPKYY